MQKGNEHDGLLAPLCARKQERKIPGAQALNRSSFVIVTRRRGPVPYFRHRSTSTKRRGRQKIPPRRPRGIDGPVDNLLHMFERVFIAVAFSLYYVTMYPILVGGFVIYVYPSWSPRAALAWIVGGVLLQAWFCFVSRSSRPRAGPALTASHKMTLPTQVGAGVLYAGQPHRAFRWWVLSKLSGFRSWITSSAVSWRTVTVPCVWLKPNSQPRPLPACAGPVRCRDRLRPGRGGSIRAVPHNTLTTAPRWTVGFMDEKGYPKGQHHHRCQDGRGRRQDATVTAGPSYLMTSACERTAAGITRPSAEAVVAFTVR